LEECERLSLLAREHMADGTRAYTAPQLARLFAKRKLTGDPDKLIIREDIRMLQTFGVVGVQRAVRETQEGFVRRFVVRSFDKSKKADKKTRERTERILTNVAEIWPPAWADLAAFRREFKWPRESIEYALRRAVEEVPSKENWLKRMDYAQEIGDEKVALLSMISAVELDPADRELLLKAAFEVTSYVQRNRDEIPVSRRGIYAGSVRAHLERSADDLDPNGLSRLAWLFLIEGNREKAWEYAARGLERDRNNRFCKNILDRLRVSGFQPRRGG